MTITGIHKDGAKMDDLVDKVNSLVITDGIGDSNNCKVCNNDGKSLSVAQKLVFHQVHSSIDNGTNKVILIDAPSGTGKSYLLSKLALKYADSLQFAVFRKDQSSELSLRQIDSYTYVSYNMRNFKLRYHEAIHMFKVGGLNNIDVLFLLLTYAQKYVHVRHSVKVIILDAYTIASPLMLLLLYIVSLKNDMTLIFAGNKLQLGAINRSAIHGRSNFDILEIFSHQTIYELTTNIRSTESQFLDKLSRYRDMLASYSSRGDAPFHFNLRYFLYRLFPNKYNPAITEDFRSTYMAYFHRTITKRMYRFMKSLKPGEYSVEPFPGVPFDVTDKNENKFFPGLLLVKGYKYVYITAAGVHHIVELLNMNCKGTKLDSLTVRYANGKTQKIERCKLNFYQILPAYRNWLEQKAKTKNKDFIHFPLRPYALTYHAALGRTISDTIELDTECPKASSVYVGLCCLPSESAIRKFHAKRDFLSFIATRYMEDVDDGMYYYRYPMTDPKGLMILEHLKTSEDSDYIKSFLKDIQWTTVTNINSFEGSTGAFLRIKRTVFQKTKKEIDVTISTPLMEVTKFIKDNPTVILDTMKSASGGLSNKSVQSKEYRNLDVYTSLSKEFSKWRQENKESKNN
ncbi:na[+]-dependent inorganic phosphate cotransporter [Nomia melanderi]|uniref:na[+]-dependent inorganic phosphate cotransporter n=1 Tax=Nomia melanderi TaxID=2448451 RepID=UPI003FCE8D81